MRVPRFYHPTSISIDSCTALTEEASHHAINVLRVKEGQPIVLFNGDGNDYSGYFSKITRRSAEVIIEACIHLSSESSLPLHLGQGVSKGDRMDWVIQKSVELGVQEITPVITERCAVKLDPERWQKKVMQWQKVMIGACEQSGRNVVPIIHPPCTLVTWLSASTQAVRILLAPAAETPLSQISYHRHGYRILIGPEGGLSEIEIKQSCELGYRPYSLGPRVLRTETAALSALSVLQALHGDL